jgi:hypothetical protein
MEFTTLEGYREACSVLYRENIFSVVGDRDCLAPFVHTPIGTAVGALFHLKNLTVHLNKLSTLKRSTWKYLCMLELDILTLDFGNDGPGIENPILAIAQVLCLTNLAPEAELRRIVINAKTVVWYRSNRTQELNPHQAFRQALSNAETPGRCPKAREMVLKGGLTARQLRDLPQDAAYNVPGWHLKDIHDGDKDTENKENEPEEKTWVWLKQEEPSR